MIPFHASRPLYPLTRRALLRGMGAAALVPFVHARGVRAAAPRPIRNLLLVTWPEGLEVGWQPTGTATAFEFQDVLAPLNPFRDRLTSIAGVKGGMNNIILQHSESTMSMWTGAKPGSGLQALSPLPSIDQLVATKISGTAPYRSLHFGVQTNVPSFISTPYVHHAGPQQPIPAEDDPNAIYRLIFGGMSSDPTALDRLRAERGSVLDFVTGRLTALRPQIAAEDRVKLDKHEESLRAIERSLTGTVGQCGTVASPGLTKAAAMADENFPAVIKLQIDLLAVALQCGVTHVATLQLSNTDSQTHIPGLVTKRTVHDAMHSGTTAERVEINRFFGKQLAYVLERLKATDTGPGSTLLDDTLVVMSSEMAIGSHSNDPIPFILAGNGGGYLKMGYALKVEKSPRHTKLLTSVVHAFGLSEVKSIGQFTGADSEGELDELRA